MASKEWLASLKPGDEVAVYGRYNTAPSIHKVARVTPSGRVLVDEGGSKPTMFINGWFRHPGSWGRSYIGEVTDKVRDDVWRARSISLLSATEWSKLDTITLRRAVAAVAAKKLGPIDGEEFV